MLGYIVWDVNPVLIDSFVQIRYYSLMFAIGFWLGFNIVAKMFKHDGAPENWLFSLLIWVVCATIIGARLGHVFFYEWDYYSQHPEHIWRTWEGGLASHGGSIAIIIAVFLYSKFTTKLSPLWTFDRLVIPIALVGALIRIGNLMNSEIYGGPTDLPWGFIFVRGNEWPGVPVHPTQIYEALCYLALFVVLMWMFWKKHAQRRPGLIFGVFLTWLFGARFLIEFVKNDQVAREATMTLNLGQQLSIPFIIIGIGLIIWAMKHPKVPLTLSRSQLPPQSKK
ncbi:MAG: prolipoprotein diacylglyceryl transferase [Muribaculaceae bacterium]